MSTLRVNTIQNASGGSSSTPEQIEQGRAKAWANVNGEGTASIRESYNYSSITDTGTGRYTMAFTTAMEDSNYSIVAGVGDISDTNRALAFTSNNIASTGYNVETKYFDNNRRDCGLGAFAVFR